MKFFSLSLYFLQMSGVAIVGLSVWTLLFKHQYVVLLASSSYQFCTYALLLAGIGAILASIIGCCGVKRENRAIILIVSQMSETEAGSII
jgi:hypothetical protein